MSKNSPKTAVAAIVVIVMGVAALQTISMLSVQSAAAQRGPPGNQGQCSKGFRELGLTKEQADLRCRPSIDNQGECIKAGFDEEFCKGSFSPPV